MKKLTMVLGTGLLLAQNAFAERPSMETYQVTITNASQAELIAPPIVIAHTGHFHLFKLGMPSSEGLSYLAENGDPSHLAAEAQAMPDVSNVVTGSPIPPAGSLTLEIEAPRHAVFSIAGMLATTNDGFMSVPMVEAPPGKVSVMAHAFDAGSERNNESCDYIPGPGCDNGSNLRDTDGAEGFVYIHNGIHGVGDLNAAMYDWRGPVAMVTIARMH